MRYLSLIALTAVITSSVPASEMSGPPTVSFDLTGQTKDQIPTLRTGGSVYFNLPDGIALTYQFSDEIGNGKVLQCSNPQIFNRQPITIPSEIQIRRMGPGGTTITENKPVRAIYFNLTGPIPDDDSDSAKLTDLRGQLAYYKALDHSVPWEQKKRYQDEIADLNDQIAQIQEEIKAYTGMSLAIAATKIDDRQLEIRGLRNQIKDRQKKIDNAGVHDQVLALQKQVDELAAKIASHPLIPGGPSKAPQLLRAGVLVVGEERKPVYYTLNRTGDASAPWGLKRFQKFPVFTTNDVPYVVVLGQRSTQDPQGLRATFTSKAGTYIDAEPVRPLLTQTSVPSAGQKALFAKVLALPACPDPPTYAYIDRVLQFTDRLAGETVYSVTVSGYGVATQTDTVTVVKGTTPSNQLQTVTAKLTLKPLDGDAWPQVHSLYRYNLATGVVWGTVRSPSFSRVATGNYLPAGCDPTMSVAGTGSTTSTTTGTTTTTTGTGSTTTGTTTTNSPSTTTTTTCMPTYQTLQVSGGPSIMPVLMFSYYWTKRDTQTKTASWSWALPVPTVGLSLSSPNDDFFLGGSSEFKFLRNVQLVYGFHLGRVTKLGANGFQNPTDSTAPQTTTSLHAGPFVGLTFNLDFVKGLFKP
jgi:hypothetical protein